MKAQAERLMVAGDWQRAERIGQDVLALDRGNADAERMMATCVKNVECEPNYRSAKLALQRGRWRAVETLLSGVSRICPEYGDPEGILCGLALRSGLAKWIREQFTLFGHTSPVSSLAFSPNGTLLASGSGDNTVRLWSLAMHREVASLAGHTAYVCAVAFSPDGTLIASGSGDETVWFWGY